MTPTSLAVRSGARLAPRPDVSRSGRSMMRLTEAITHFLHHLGTERQSSPLTVTDYRTTLGQYVAWLQMTLMQEGVHGVKAKRTHPDDLMHFTADRIRAWQAHLALAGTLEVNTVRKKLHALASFAKFLVRTGAIGRNPMEQVVLPKERTRTTVGMPLDVWQRIMGLALAPREQCMRGLLALVGLRRQELLDVRAHWLHLDLHEPVIVVRGKGDKDREVPVPDSLCPVLTDYLLRTRRIRDELVFQTDDLEPYHPSVINLIVRGWGEAVGWPRLHPHLFRHAYASILEAQHVPPSTIQRWLGHASLTTTSRYLHGDQQAARGRLNAWAAATIKNMAPALPAIVEPDESMGYGW